MHGTANRIDAQRGFTLIEVMAATAIFAIVMAAFLQLLMSVHSTNRSLTAAMTANAVIRSMADEAMAAAAENSADFDGSFARAFVNYYGEIPAGETLPIDDALGNSIPRVRVNGGVLTYSFVVPEPGSFSRYAAAVPWGGNAGETVPYEYGLGEMRIYLNEEAMPDLDGMFSDAGTLGNALWETMGDNPGETGEGQPANIDGISLSSLSDLQNPPAGLKRVFADIRVTYYDPLTRTREISLNERRIIVTGTMNSQSLFG